MPTDVPRAPPSGEISEEEAFHNAYRTFLNAVTILSASAEAQCEEMGDYNVAWELKDDVSAGRYLVGRGFLTQEQEAAILAVSAALENIPTSVVHAASGRHANLIAMGHNAWVSLRAQASRLLHLLRPFSERNAKYLRLENDVP